jgi:predicted SAM-dependent methyltransferase
MLAIPEWYKEKSISTVWDIVGKPEGLCLHLGSGKDYHAGYINVDRYVDADVDWDFFHLPLKDNSVNIIICNDTLEHFGHHEIVPLLKEWCRVLKPIGHLFLCIPDIVSTCQLMLKDPDNYLNLCRIYGLQTTPGQYHKTNFTYKRIHNLLMQSGFTTIYMGGYVSLDKLGRIFLEARK